MVGGNEIGEALSRRSFCWRRAMSGREARGTLKAGQTKRAGAIRLTANPRERSNQTEDFGGSTFLPPDARRDHGDGA